MLGWVDFALSPLVSHADLLLELLELGMTRLDQYAFGSLRLSAATAALAPGHSLRTA